MSCQGAIQKIGCSAPHLTKDFPLTLWRRKVRQLSNITLIYGIFSALGVDQSAFTTQRG